MWCKRHPSYLHAPCIFHTRTVSIQATSSTYVRRGGLCFCFMNTTPLGDVISRVHKPPHYRAAGVQYDLNLINISILNVYIPFRHGNKIIVFVFVTYNDRRLTAHSIIIGFCCFVIYIYVVCWRNLELCYLIYHPWLRRQVLFV